MIRPKIGLDWDDVTAPFNSIAIDMANKKYNITPPLELEDIDSWENTGRASVIKEFYRDNTLYERQKPTEETKRMIRKLMDIGEVYFITAVAPGFIDTPSTREALSQTIVDQWTKQVPLRRLGTAAEVSHAVRFLKRLALDAVLPDLPPVPHLHAMLALSGSAPRACSSRHRSQGSPGPRSPPDAQGPRSPAPAGPRTGT